MKRRGFVAYGITVAGISLLTADVTISALSVAFDVGDKVTAWAVAGWVAVSFIPISLSILVWIMEVRVEIRWRWLPHLLFIPAAIAVVRIGFSLYFRETDLLPDSLMTESTLLAATGYLLLTLVVHLAAFVAAVARASHKPDGS